jgi:ribose transport system permease protein
MSGIAWSAVLVVRRRARDYAVLGCLVALAVALSVGSDSFLTSENLINLLNGNVVLGLTALGATLVVIAGGFDLSNGALYALSGVISAWVAVRVDPVLGLLCGVLAGVVLGAANGALISTLNLNSFLATLATGLMFGGFALYITDGFLVDVTRFGVFTTLGETEVLGLPLPVVILLAATLVTGFVLQVTHFGRHVYAVGGNAEAARLSGISAARVRIGVFAASGLLAAMAGVIDVAKTGTGQASAGGTIPLDAISAVVIGGTSIMGGRGSVWRTVIGVLLLALIHNGFNLLNVAPYFQNVLTGLIIIVAIAANAAAGQK